MDAQALTQEQIGTIREFAAEVAETLDIADASFGARRRLIEMLNVRATLSIEDENRVVDASCGLDEDVLSIENNLSCSDRHNRHKPFVLTARLVLPKPTRGKRGG